MKPDRIPCSPGIVEAFDRAEQHPRRIFFEDPAGSLTFGETCLRIRKIAGILDRWGLQAGDRVVLASREDRAVIVLFLALLRWGLAPVLLDAAAGPERARSLIEASLPSAFLVDEELVSSWGIARQPRILSICSERTNGILGRWNQRAPVNVTAYPRCLDGLEAAGLPGYVDPESDAYVLYTSGTTTEPKGVRIRHRSLFAHLATLGRVFGYGPDSRIFNNLMLSHADGIIQGPVIAFAHTVAFYRTAGLMIQELPRVIDELYRLRITHFVTVPAILALLLRLCDDRRDPLQTEDLRMVISCGAQLEADLWRKFEERTRIPVVNMYGLTETVAGGIFAGPDAATRRFGTIGKPVDCEARICGPDGSTMGSGGRGELELRGDMLMAGYLHAPEATAAVLSEDGWFRTGDLAHQEDDGCLRIIGRKKALIIRGGFNVHPEEVTEVLHRNPAILEAVTFGVPDPLWGERVVSAVVLDAERPLEEADLIGHCRLHLEPQKIPSRILRLKELPRGRSKKVLLEEVKRIAVEALDPDHHAMAQDDVPFQDIEKGVLEEAGICFRVSGEVLDLGATPSNCPGWDSLAHLNFITGLEQRFRIQLRPDEILAIGSLRQAAQIVKARCANA